MRECVLSAPGDPKLLQLRGFGTAGAAGECHTPEGRGRRRGWISAVSDVHGVLWNPTLLSLGDRCPRTAPDGRAGWGQGARSVLTEFLLSVIPGGVLLSLNHLPATQVGTFEAAPCVYSPFIAAHAQSSSGSVTSRGCFYLREQENEAAAFHPCPQPSSDSQVMGILIQSEAQGGYSKGIHQTTTEL